MEEVQMSLPMELHDYEALMESFSIQELSPITEICLRFVKTTRLCAKIKASALPLRRSLIQ